MQPLIIVCDTQDISDADETAGDLEYTNASYEDDGDQGCQDDGDQGYLDNSDQGCQDDGDQGYQDNGDQGCHKDY